MNILEMFENNLRLLRKDSELTITSHMRTAKLAVEAMGEDAKSWDITSFYKFVNALDGLNVANTTYNKMRMSFLCLIDFVIGSRVNKELDIEFIRKNFTKKSTEKDEVGENPIPISQYEAFVNFLRFENDTIDTQRRKVATLLITTTGLRKNEARMLLKSDVNLDTLRIDPSTTKYSKGREVEIPMPSYLAHEIQVLYDLYEELGMDGDYVLLSNSKTSDRCSPLDPKSLENMIKSATKKAIKKGVISPNESSRKDYYTAHGLRKSFAVYLLKVKGVDIDTVRQLLGHTSTAQTDTYIKGSKQDIDDIMSKVW